MKIYNVGIIGFGFIGKVHGYSLMNMPFFYENDDFGIRITHVCTSNSETAVKAARVCGAENAVTDFREITENPDIDIVDICSPNALHAEQLLSAMKMNKHIYCEKPVTKTYEEALRIKNALCDYRGISQMTFHNRFFPVTMRAAEIVKSGAIGEILEFSCDYLHSGNADPGAVHKWKSDDGVTLDLGSHVVDLIESLTGPFDSLCAYTRTAFNERPLAGNPLIRKKVEGDDSMHVMATLSNGASGILRSSKIATGAEDELSFEIYGTKGALRLEKMDLHKLYYFDASKSDAPHGGFRGWQAIDCGQRYGVAGNFPTPKAPIGWLRGHVHCMHTFLESVHIGKPSDLTLERGIYIQNILDKIRISASEKRWIKL